MFCLIFLHLNENKFINGDLPPSLQNLKRLQVLDLGGNGLQGLIPAGSGIKLLELRVLRLQSNGFLGNITTLPTIKSSIVESWREHINEVYSTMLC